MIIEDAEWCRGQADDHREHAERQKALGHDFVSYLAVAGRYERIACELELHARNIAAIAAGDDAGPVAL